jgi:hypothetical protein
MMKNTSALAKTVADEPIASRDRHCIAEQYSKAAPLLAWKNALCRRALVCDSVFSAHLVQFPARSNFWHSSPW